LKDGQQSLSPRSQKRKCKIVPKEKFVEEGQDTPAGRRSLLARCGENPRTVAIKEGEKRR